MNDQEFLASLTDLNASFLQYESQGGHFGRDRAKEEEEKKLAGNRQEEAERADKEEEDFEIPFRTKKSGARSAAKQIDSCPNAEEELASKKKRVTRSVTKKKELEAIEEQENEEEVLPKSGQKRKHKKIVDTIARKIKRQKRK